MTRRMRRGTALTLTFTAALLGTGCGHGRHPLGGVRLTRTEFLGEIWNETSAAGGVVAQDGGLAWPVPGGALWAFGDTFLGTVDSDGDRIIRGMAGTTIALHESGVRRFPPALRYWTDSSGRAAMPIPLGPGESSPEHRFWPLAGVAANGKCYLFYSLIERTAGEGPWNFRGLGDGLAWSRGPLGMYERVRHGASEEWRFPVAPSQIVERGEWLWLYEARAAGSVPGAVLARVRPRDIEDPDAYEFWTGPGETFSPHRDEARLIAENIHGQVSVAWNPFAQRYLMATSSDFTAPRTIRLRAAREPWGPWSEPVLEIEVPEREGQTTTLVYCTYLHPELFELDGRRVVLTHCRMLSGEWELTNPEMTVLTFDRRRGEP